MNAIPGGPFNKEKATDPKVIQTLEERYNLDKPVGEQYVIYMKNLLHGDWGISLHSGRPIWDDMISKFSVSAKLGGRAAIIAIIDELIQQIYAETDYEKRVQLMREAEDMLMSTYAVVPIYYYNDVYLQKSNVSGVYTALNQNKYFMYAEKK